MSILSRVDSTGREPLPSFSGVDDSSCSSRFLSFLGQAQMPAFSFVSADMTALIARVDAYARAVLSPPRYEHSRRVAEFGCMLVRRYALEAQLEPHVYCAGIAHDMCREHSEVFLLRAAACDGFPIDVTERGTPLLLHGRAAACVLAQEFGVQDEVLLSAVRWHTFGCEDFGVLGKILFISDKIEPARAWAASLRGAVSTLTLDALAAKVVSASIVCAERKRTTPHPRTCAMLRALGKDVSQPA
ncbi:bis(5'-nucleosyl)-tetraphosphatase (symmetrical) YqeK [Treponema pallidum]|uniref:bis(5'-nucleosyl)-tetraphosphatase (symmetrical) YqeK n=1 Tax=Treponema pallidum TaxID=160 RepID=UPI001F44E4D9|nr:bis(5'-nucleosyl)-tetraphosphatase (symmetrical) YqeK [Treponema pallidum]QUJ41785.2 bis(5'-nucleosyl)-tetraphosphatase (symmetrical) YqeK [Treponema pallidum]QUJ42750.2 bis(5'-nucleosyl)-tetraphosphatase (symmetrical) YqeK [Treponema pallidum]QUJ44681.2 bis(5'-nucleosyl)-tetraphosphatase (symmetrical) YqeK [Treponema pallidum]QUJ46612.2 bis(5'-nucleosyl)-tetraphosphatase (symmetrical) YqeK [Treponema pallidum]QUJ47575.2 bis(5'-nucleosyl)-tetraphosphatase (symmetrical) YqeK [Treponema palli